MAVQVLNWLRAVKTALEWGLLAAACVWLAGLAEGKTSIPFAPRVLLCMLPLACLWLGLASFRRTLATMADEFLIRTGLRPLVYVGVWGVFTVSQPGRAGVASTVPGQDHLFRIYEDTNSVRKARIIAAARWLEESSTPSIAREAAVFLEMVGY